MARVNLQGVSKVFPGGVTAVNKLDLEVKDREFVVLVGPSGCGKSTTLRLIAGLEDASEGVIRIGQRAVNDVTPKDRDIAMVFQNYALYPHMTVYKNMAFGLELRYGGGWPARFCRRLFRPAAAARLAAKREGINDRVRQAAGILGIDHLLDRMPRQLSGGERQRVALGRAIVRQPAVFLFDEPLSNLDAKLRVQMRRELKRLHQQLQATMVYVTHDQVEALTLGDLIVVMNHGIVQQVGPPMDVYDRPKNRFVAGFIGTPLMNFVEGKLRQLGQRVKFTGGGVTAVFDADESGPLERHVNCDVVFGVRPEDVDVIMDKTQPDGRCVTPAAVSVVEALGDSSILHLEVAQAKDAKNRSTTTLRCKTEARPKLRPGDAVNVVFHTRRAHLFSPESGENMRWTSA